MPSPLKSCHPWYPCISRRVAQTKTLNQDRESAGARFLHLLGNSSKSAVERKELDPPSAPPAVSATAKQANTGGESDLLLKTGDKYALIQVSSRLRAYCELGTAAVGPVCPSVSDSHKTGAWAGIAGKRAFARYAGEMADASWSLSSLTSGRPGLTPPEAQSLVEAAAVCLADQGHTQLVPLRLTGEIGRAHV